MHHPISKPDLVMLSNCLYLEGCIKIIDKQTGSTEIGRLLFHTRCLWRFSVSHFRTLFLGGCAKSPMIFPICFLTLPKLGKKNKHQVKKIYCLKIFLAIQKNSGHFVVTKLYFTDRTLQSHNTLSTLGDIHSNLY